MAVIDIAIACLTWSILDEEANQPTFIVDEVSQLSYPVINVLQSTEETDDEFDAENEQSIDISRDQVTTSFLMSISDRMIG